MPKNTEDGPRNGVVTGDGEAIEEEGGKYGPSGTAKVCQAVEGGQ